MNGFTSHIHKCSIQLAARDSSQNPNVEVSVVLKMYSSHRVGMLTAAFAGNRTFTEAKLAAIVTRFSTIHNRECDFYSLLGYKYRPVPLPEVYYIQRLEPGTEATGLIMMRDLSGCSYLDRIEDGLGKRKVENVVRHLAALHKLTLCMEEREERLEPFRKQIYEWEEANTRLNMSIEQAMEMEPRVAHLLRRMKRAISREYIRLAYHDLAESRGIPAVLVHGDLKTNNLLWLLDGDGRETDVLAAFFDWQMAFAGNPMHDIARLLIWCETDVRRELDTYILQLYHDELSRLMWEDGGGKPLFTVGDLRAAYEIMLPNQAVMFAMVAPFFRAVSGWCDMSIWCRVDTPLL